MNHPNDFVIENGILIEYNGPGGDVVIPEGVTSVGLYWEYPFKDCETLTGITIPYYKGVVVYKSVEYPGAYEAIVSNELWDTVQTILASRVNGERTLKHPHFLKGSIYCANCGSRMIVSNEKKKDGTVYPYFVCGGRHSKREKDCTTKAVLIYVIEKKIEEIYDAYQLPSELRAFLEEYLQEIIAREREKSDSELNGLIGEKSILERKRQKLLEAHYNDAIPLDLLRTEQ